MIGFGGRSIDELSVGYECDVDRTTGASALRIPVPLPPGRNGFGPSFALSYTSGGGNSPFGAGWALTGLPTIGIDTREHVPRWDGSDGYQLSGDELVPWLEFDGAKWKPRGLIRGDWSVAFLRSRTGGSQLRVEKWVHRTTGRIHFRTRDARNTVTIFGARADGRSRLSDPNDASRTFVWLPEVELDSAGNAVWFEYEPETLAGVDRSTPFERRRAALAQRYLKRVRYGNARPVTITDDVVAGTLPTGVRWCFQGVFDYGDHSQVEIPQSIPDRAWPARLDPFSTCRPGFEIRTYRLCRRILSFHNFDELGLGPTLTGALVLTHNEDAAGSTLREITFVGHRLDAGVHSSRSLPPLRMTYAGPFVAPTFVAAPVETQRNAPAGLAARRYAFVDLFGEGLPGILEESERAWFYKPNEGNGNFGDQRLVVERPATRRSAWSFGDVNHDGNTDLSQQSGRMAGLFTHDRDRRRWSGFRPFDALPHVEGIQRAQWVDLNGDGRPDIVIPKGDRLAWFASDGEGFADPVESTLPLTTLPVVAEDTRLELFFADMNGDGLVDLVRVSNGCVEYWPSLGNGHFGESVLLEGSPRFASEDEFDPVRLRFIDLDGSGTADLIYLGRGEVSVWHNSSGNRLTAGPRLTSLPYLDSVSTIGVLDFLGNGRPCLVWSTPLPGRETSLHYLPLAAVERPRLLLSVDDSLGQETRFTYSSSASHYLRDQRSGQPWITHLPSHMPVVDQREVRDAIGGTLSLQRFEYHDGFYDGVERQFRGFGRVDAYDLEAGTPGPEPGITASAPSLVRTWNHVGPATRQPLHSAYTGDADLPLLQPHVVEGAELTPEEIEDAQRAIAGRIIRSETWSVNQDGTLVDHPFEITQVNYRVVRAQPALKGARAAFEVMAEESLDVTYEQTAADPRLSQTLHVTTGALGVPEITAEISYARRAGRPRDIAAQDKTTVLVHQQGFVHFDSDDRFEIGIPIESREFELTGVVAAAGRITRTQLRASDVANAIAAPLRHHELLPPGVAARLLAWDQSFYWNNDRTAALPFGQIGAVVLVHHEESACFSPEFIASVYEGRVDAPLLTAAHYFERDGLLWQSDEIHFFGGAANFFQREALEQPDGSRTIFEYDPYGLELTAQIDPFTNRIEAVIDYHTLAASRIRDLNGNVTEVRYDPLGVVVTTTSHGHVGAQPWGFEEIAAIVARTPTNTADLLAQPNHYLQGASQFVYYDLDAWRRDGAPPATVRLTRVELRHDGQGNVTPGSRIQIEVTYLDGLSRPLQTKNIVEAGPAIQRDRGGVVVVDGGGRPVLADSAERWQVSGHVVYDAKQQPRRQYGAYFSPTWQYEDDLVLRQFGTATLISYDALGRETSQFLPNGTATRTTYGPWVVEGADVNDTVMDSAYRDARELFPADDPERQALEHAKRHAGTNTSAFLDPDGRIGGSLELGGPTTDDRRTESRFDSQGNIFELIDARGLTAFTYRRDMQGRELHVHSVDAGDTRTFYDSQDRPIRMWDGRGYEIEQDYDELDRLKTVLVRGNGLDHRVEERTYGGNDAAAVANNLNGALVSIRDQSGEVSVTRYDPAGRPIATTQRIRTETGEADWRAAVALDTTVFATETSFDALGRVHRSVRPDDSTRTLSYLPGGGLERITVTTGDGKVVNVPVLDGATYNAKGQRNRVSLGNGVAIEYRYDANTSRLVSQTARNATRTFQDAQYTYDPVGNIVRIVDNALTGPNAVVTGSVLPPRRNYEYDAHYRLTRATGRVHQALLQHDYIPAIAGPLKGTRHMTLNNGAALEAFTRQYEYDPSGNIRRVRHLGTTQSWTTDMWISPSSNRSIPLLDAGGIAVPAPESKFDAAGNLISVAHLRSIDWSWRSTLLRAVIIERPGDIDDDEVYTYGSDGMRVRKVTTRKIGDGAAEVIEKVYFGDCERKRITRNGVLILERWTSHFHSTDERIALLHRWTRDDNGRETDDITPARFRYQLCTHQGSSAIELDENGGVVSYEEYFPYGGSSFIAGDRVRDVEIKEYRYSGKERDDATSLYYYGHRYYAPWMCRWMSPDPIGPEDALNLYQFVLGDPVGKIDEDGLDTVPGGQVVPLGAVRHTLSERQARAQFNAGRGIELGIQATRLRSLGDGNWLIVSYTRIPPNVLPYAQRFHSVATGELLASFEQINPNPFPPGQPPSQPPGGGSSQAGPGQGNQGNGGDGAAGQQTPAPPGTAGAGGNDANAGGGQGNQNADPEARGRGGGGSDEGEGPGSGLQGRGNGGGGRPGQTGLGQGTSGEGRTSGTGVGEGVGAGTGTDPNGGTGQRAGPDNGGQGQGGGGSGQRNRTGPGDGGGGRTAGDGDGGVSTGNPNGSAEGVEGGSPNGVPGGVVGGTGTNPSQTGTGTSGLDTTGNASGNGTENGGTSEQGLGGSGGQPSQGTGDPNASGDRSTGGPPRNREDRNRRENAGQGQGQGSGRNGGQSSGGSSGGSPNGTANYRENALDTLTRFAGYANLEFSQGGPGGQRGGIPGGSGRFNLGWAGQVAFIALTVLSFVGPGAVLKGLRLGGRLALRGLSWAARAIATGGRALVRGIASVGGRALSSRNLIHALVDFARRGSTTRGFQRAPFGQFRLRDLSFGLGDWRVSVNRIWVDPAMSRLQRTATFLHEGVHWLSNQFLPNIARFKQYAGQSSLRGFIGSNVKFYEESIAYTVGGLVGRPFEIIGFIPAWTRSLAGSSTARLHVVLGLPFVAGGVAAGRQAYNEVFGRNSGR